MQPILFECAGFNLNRGDHAIHPQLTPKDDFETMGIFVYILEFYERVPTSDNKVEIRGCQARVQRIELKNSGTEFVQIMGLTQQDFDEWGEVMENAKTRQQQALNSNRVSSCHASEPWMSVSTASAKGGLQEKETVMDRVRRFSCVVPEVQIDHPQVRDPTRTFVFPGPRCPTLVKFTSQQPYAALAILCRPPYDDLCFYKKVCHVGLLQVKLWGEIA